MKNVSNAFKTSISSPSRMCAMRVTFDISDTTANSDVASITTSSQFKLSDKQQLIDKERDNSYKLATFEKDRLLLDGSFVIPSPTDNGNTGWWSDVLCDENGLFTPSQDIIIQFNNTHSSIGLTITFADGEYATDFDILAYDSNNVLINEFNVTNNTKTMLAVETHLYLYKKIVIKIKKWYKPYHRAKVTEIDFGVVRVYNDDNLIRANLIEELDLTSANVIPSEMKFTVDNSSREFNILNPRGIYKFLQQRQQVITELGVDVGNRIEYTRMGMYYLKDWQSDEGSLTTTFTARDVIDLLESYTYENLTISNTNLKAVSELIFVTCGITDYVIDSELANVSTTGLIEKTICRNALQMVAIASRSNIFVINNVVHIKYNNIDLNTATKVADVDMDNMYSEPQISLDSLVKSVSVEYYTDIDTKDIATSANPNITNGDMLEVKGNTLISNSTVAKNVGEWIIKMRNLRAIYTANWRQNPALDTLDVVNVENAYNTNKAIITKQEYEYQGYLSGKSELKGLIDIVE